MEGGERERERSTFFSTAINSNDHNPLFEFLLFNTLDWLLFSNILQAQLY